MAVANPLDSQIENELTEILERLSSESWTRHAAAESTRALSSRLEVVRGSDSTVSETLRLGKLIELVNRAQSLYWNLAASYDRLGCYFSTPS
jgi:hypothetical protein